MERLGKPGYKCDISPIASDKKNNGKLKSDDKETKDEDQEIRFDIKHNNMVNSPQVSFLFDNRRLTYEYFRVFYKIISKHSKMKIKEMRQKDYLAMRRQAAKDHNNKLYQQIVIEMISEEEKIQSLVLEEACSLVGLSEETFLESL